MTGCGAKQTSDENSAKDDSDGAVLPGSYRENVMEDEYTMSDPSWDLDSGYGGSEQFTEPFEGQLSNKVTWKSPGANKAILGIEDSQAISRKLEHWSASYEAILPVKAESPPFFDNISISERLHGIVSDPRAPKAELKPSIKRESEESPEIALSQTPLSEASSMATEKYIDERKSQIVDRVVLLVTSWLRSRFALAHQVAGESSNASSSCGTYSAPQGRDSSSNNLNNATKRKVSDRNKHSAGDDEDDAEQDRRQTKIRNAKDKEAECLRYACPYFKYNPSKYKDWRGCPGPGWPDVHRVKCVHIH